MDAMRIRDPYESRRQPIRKDTGRSLKETHDENLQQGSSKGTKKEAREANAQMKEELHI